MAKVELRGCANRRVANVAIDDEEAIRSFGGWPGAKSCQPIGASSKPKNEKKQKREGKKGKNDKKERGSVDEDGEEEED